MVAPSAHGVWPKAGVVPRLTRGSQDLQERNRRCAARAVPPLLHTSGCSVALLAADTPPGTAVDVGSLRFVDRRSLGRPG